VRISDQTIHRVRGIALEMGYLSRGIVGLIVPQMGGYFGGMIGGVMDVLRTEKYSLAIGMPTNWDTRREIEEVRLMEGKGFDGLLVGATPQFVEQLEKAPYLFYDRKRVVLMNWPSHSEIPYAAVDHECCGYLATKHLLELGHCRIAFAGVSYLSENHRSGIPIVDARFRGYLRAMQEHDLPYISAEPVEAVLDLLKEVTGVYCGRVLGTLNLLGACYDRGVRVPEDLSIVGQDEDREKSEVRPRMTTVDVHERDVGARAARMVLDLIAGKAPESAVVQPKLIVRESTRAV
jgi:LacI family transcriptional regulator